MERKPGNNNKFAVKLIFYYNVGSTMNIFKKLIFTLSAFFALSHSFSMAGIQQSIPNSSGEYVYYRDSAFERESYIGFLYYDEGTISVRYYAPAVRNTKPLLPAKDIEILFTLNTKKDAVEFTGERILSAVSSDDTDLINYIHDSIYELGARRKNAGLVSERMISKEDFPQFGGLVNIEFDPIVPFFNIRGITGADGKKVLTLVTAGQLISNTDKSFSEFFGFSRTDESKSKFKENKKAQKIETSYEGKNITLDSQWTQSMDNLWLLGNDAILTMNTFELPSEEYWLKLCRKLTLGTENSFPKSELQVIKRNDKAFEVNNVFYQPVTGTLTRDFKILEKSADGKVTYFALTVFNHTFTGNEKYFKKILDSYK